MIRQEHSSAMLSMVEQWQQSGMTQTEFAQGQNITLVKFRYWIRKYRETEQGPAFIQLNSFMQQNINIKYPNGVELPLPAQTPAAILRSLINF